jgi:pyruvate dehydrogenase E2 component (dihydrolipoamide acetyltransferase)
MTTKVTMPQMGESVFEGTLTKWLKKAGDFVQRDEPLFEISTDKVDSEIPSPASGILAEILVPEGKTIQINTVVAIINEADAPGVKSEVPVAEGEASVSEPAAAMEKTPSARPSGPVEPAKAEPQPVRQAAPAPAGTEAGGINIQDIRTSPLVRRLARENNVDLAAVRGTGLEGRITKEDLFAFLAQRSGVSAARQEPAMPAEAVRAEGPGGTPSIQEQAPSPDAATSSAPRFIGESEIVPMSPMRKAIAERMVLSKRTSAHVNTVFEVDMSAVVRLREANKAEFERREGIALTFTPFFAKALIDTVREFPIVNASVSGDSIVYKKPVNLGIAVALETGLIVPVIRDAQLKSFTGLALAIHDAAQRARTKKLKPDDVQNGTISMTNPGSFGSLFNIPIINQPQVAILGVGGIDKRPVVIDDAIAIRSMVCLSLTFDHRVIDGAVADQFMAKLKTRLQSWTQWMD